MHCVTLLTLLLKKYKIFYLLKIKVIKEKALKVQTIAIIRNKVCLHFSQLVGKKVVEVK